MARDPMTPERSAPGGGGAGEGRPRLPVGLVIGGLLVLSLIAYGGHLLLAEASAGGPGLSAEAVAAFIRSWGRWAVAAAILLMILHSFVPVPAELLAVVNGMLFGPLKGIAVTWIGAMLGAYLAFGLARALGRPFVLRMLPERQRRQLDDWALRQGGVALLIARLVPVIAFNAVNYAAGLSKVSWWTFSWSTALGILPLTALMVIIGDRMLSGAWSLWLAVASGAAALALLGWWLWRRRGREEARRRAGGDASDG